MHASNIRHDNVNLMLSHDDDDVSTSYSLNSAESSVDLLYLYPMWCITSMTVPGTPCVNNRDCRHETGCENHNILYNIVI